jgi:hypothetical protein
MGVPAYLVYKLFILANREWTVNGGCVNERLLAFFNRVVALEFGEYP